MDKRQGAIMSENDEPTKNMLELIRVLLSRSMDEEQAKNLKDDEIAWMAPIVEHELGKLASRDALIVILRYGLSTCRPLNYEEIAEVMNRPKGVTRGQAVKVVARAVKQLSTEITQLNADERNLCLLLAGKEDGRSVIDETSEATVASSVEVVIERLKWIQFKYNVWSFIYE